MLIRTLQCIALFAAFVLGYAGSAQAQLYNGKELVRASLISDVNSIAPGQKFRVGVLYRIEPGWHVYWKYSGDSGIPTKIEWQLPQGFKVGDLQWPLPMRDKEPGDLEVFDYCRRCCYSPKLRLRRLCLRNQFQFRRKAIGWCVRICASQAGRSCRSI